MPYPTIYGVTYSYTGFQQAQGNNAFPGTQLDADLAGLQSSVSNLALFAQGVLRSDGQIQNGSVTYDSLSASLQTAGLAPATAWATAVSYLLGNAVTINSNLYRCIVPHTSGVFATDLTAGKWVLISALITGPQGPQGIAGLTYGGTSTTSLLIANNVTKVFTTQAGLAYQVGTYVRASSAANGANYMEGTVSAYSGTSLSIAVTKIGGSGTYADWGFAVAGAPGSVFSNLVDVKLYGAKFDGVTDDTAAIAAAIAATPSGGTLLFPAGTAVISGSGSYIFNITTPINILGLGATVYGGVGTTLQVSAAGTRDVFYITGAINAITRGYSFKNFNVMGASGGRHVFHFDSTAGTSTNFADVMIDSVMSNAGSSGYTVYFNNGTGANPGPFNITVQNCYINAGINFQKVGDTLRVLNNLITGSGIGVVSDQVSGAGQLVVLGCNITTNGGCVTVYNGISPILAFNQMEQINANTEANNSMVDFIGNVSNGKVVCNQIQSLTGTAIPIRVANAAGTYVDGNRLSTTTAYANVVITAAATGTVIGLGNLFTVAGGRVSDAGAGTLDPLGPWTAYTPTITPSAGAFGSASATGRYKLVGKTLYLQASASIPTIGTATGTFTLSLPPGMTSMSSTVITGKDTNVNGYGAQGGINAGGTTLSVSRYDGASMIVAGTIIPLTGVIEIQ